MLSGRRRVCRIWRQFLHKMLAFMAFSALIIFCGSIFRASTDSPSGTESDRLDIFTFPDNYEDSGAVGRSVQRHNRALQFMDSHKNERFFSDRSDIMNHQHSQTSSSSSTTLTSSTNSKPQNMPHEQQADSNKIHLESLLIPNSYPRSIKQYDLASKEKASIHKSSTVSYKQAINSDISMSKSGSSTSVYRNMDTIQLSNTTQGNNAGQKLNSSDQQLKRLPRQNLNLSDLSGQYLNSSDPSRQYLNSPALPRQYLNSSDLPGQYLPEMQVKRLPKVIIIGAKKAGTRALLEFLRLHPNVEGTGPEPHFFDRNYNRGLDWYRDLMPKTYEHQITIEKTPGYFVTHDAPRRIFDMDPAIRLILVVRDPVTRAISDYCQASSKHAMKQFEQMALLDERRGLVNTSWAAIKIGVYAKHMEHWLHVFSLDQIHLVDGQKLVEEPAREVGKVETFLGLPRYINDSHFYLRGFKGTFPCLIRDGKPHCLDEKTKGREHPVVKESVLQRLRTFYKPFNAKFYQMVGRKFDWS